MKYEFRAKGHENILGTHKTTFEFTKDKEVSLKGDCIIGVDCDFDPEEIKKFILGCGVGKFKVIISWKGYKEEIIAEINPDFKSTNELVIRKTQFNSSRTLGIKANKAAIELERGLISYLRSGQNDIAVFLENMP